MPVELTPSRRGDDQNSAGTHAEESHDHDIVFPSTIAFILVHLACLGVIWTGFSWETVILAISLYIIRMFAVTAGYHRYFSHRSFKTSRPFQFFLAFLAQTSAQRGAKPR